MIPQLRGNQNLNLKNNNKDLELQVIDWVVDNKVIDNKFSLITSFAMFYDLEDPNAFCKDIESLLDEDGLWISEFSYFPLLLKNLTYDQICHEHVAYYTLSTFKKIANQTPQNYCSRMLISLLFRNNQKMTIYEHLEGTSSGTLFFGLFSNLLHTTCSGTEEK